MTEERVHQGDALARLERRALREREARKLAERLLEEKSLELYTANRALEDANERLKALTHELELKVDQRTAELQDALIRAESAAQHKSEFLAKMSHEIRTPLNGVLGMAQLLVRSGLAAQQKQWVETLLGSGDMLRTILDDVLDLAKIEAGKLELEQHTFDVNREIEQVLALYRPLARQKGIALECDCSGVTPVWVEGDSGRLKQVIGNLVSNAIKFTTHGGVKVLVEHTPHFGDLLSLDVRVLDTGIGISKEGLAELFQEFRQVDRGAPRAPGGTGLGLSICKRLVHAMNGEIGAQSTAGVGSEFRFRVLLRVAASESLRESSNAVRPAEPFAPMELAALSILVAEDQLPNQLLMRGLLDPLVGYVELAETGADAVAAVRRRDFHVVLMDVQMPVMDGLAATRAIRELHLSAQPVIVGLSAAAFDEDRQACKSAGMDHFFSKPVALAELLAYLQSITRDAPLFAPHQ